MSKALSWPQTLILCLNNYSCNNEIIRNKLYEFGYCHSIIDAAVAIVTLLANTVLPSIHVRNHNNLLYLSTGAIRIIVHVFWLRQILLKLLVKAMQILCEQLKLLHCSEDLPEINLHWFCTLQLRIVHLTEISFSSMQVKKLFSHKDGRPLLVYERLLAGSTAGVIAQTAIYPMEVCL